MKKFLSLLCLCVFLSVLIISPLSVSAATTVSTTRYELTNLGIPMQQYVSNTHGLIYGRSIWDIAAFNGRIYIASGEFNSNLGSSIGSGMPVFSYNTAKNQWKREKIVPDEQVHRFIVTDDKLYMPGMDPITGNDGNFYSVDKNGTWATTYSYPGKGVHVFDMLVKDGVIYASFGFNNNEAAIVRYSTDGVNFSDIPFKKNNTSVKGTSSTYVRVYNMFEFKDEIYAVLRMTNGNGSYDGIYKLNSQTMTFNYLSSAPSSLLIYGINPSFDTEFDGKLISAYSTLNYSTDLKTWKTVTGFEGTVTCAKVFNDALYFSAYTKKSNGDYISNIYKTTDLTNFELVYSLDFDTFIYSFCYDNGAFYFGTSCDRSLKETTVGTVFSITPIEQKGDVDGDGKIDTSDLAALKLYLADSSTLDAIKPEESDLDGNGEINTSDLAILKLSLVE